ncbi:PD-(D/E)XK nuclease family protein, partial [Alphaproteobacteria bacterium]|nr:PD-(D/E)XK nuclease family protein [Alphaproteobacteria bacterium]
PRLAILGPLEARLQSYDLMVIGGLNEGSMPPDIGGDPWMSRPMRRAFGLPPPERRIGLSAHDFINAAAAPEVVLTRAQRVEGGPSEPSRWLLRLDAVITALQLPSPQQASAVWIAWAQGLDHPQTEQRVAPPAPTPPLAARPSRYSVTEIETLLRDPYAIYARRILNLKRLEPLDADPGAADRGTIIHHVLDQFVSKYPHEIPLDGYQQLLEMGRLAFANLPDNPGVWAFWWPRFMRIAAWFIGVEKNRRQALERIWSEVGGSMHIETGGRRIELRTKIDRIERRLDGGLAIIDYKTGHVPSSADVARGWSPQLPLEALILMAGGVAEVPADEIVGLEYWRLSGLSPAGEVRPLKDVTALIFDATEGLQALLTTFEQPETPFMALPNPAAEPRFGDYRHLARVKEWGSER